MPFSVQLICLCSVCGRYVYLDDKSAEKMTNYYYAAVLISRIMGLTCSSVRPSRVGSSKKKTLENPNWCEPFPRQEYPVCQYSS